MKCISLLSTFIFAILSTLTAAYAQPSSSDPVRQVVDCSSGGYGQLQDALDNSDRSKRLVLKIRGTCRGVVEIWRDNVTITGPSSFEIRGSIIGPVYIFHARNVRFQSIRIIRGADIGVQALRASDVTLTHVLIEGHERGAVGAFYGSVMRVLNATITGSTIGDDVVFARDGSTLLIYNSSITSNANKIGGGAAIAVSNNSNVRIDERNTITNTRGPGPANRALVIRAHNGSTVSINGTLGLAGRGATITGNIALSLSSTADIQEAAITGKLLLQRLSTAELNTTSSLSDTAQVSSRSMLSVDGTSTVAGQVTCTGASSITGDNAGTLNASGCTITD